MREGEEEGGGAVEASKEEVVQCRMLITKQDITRGLTYLSLFSKCLLLLLGASYYIPYVYTVLLRKRFCSIRIVLILLFDVSVCCVIGCNVQDV